MLRELLTDGNKIITDLEKILSVKYGTCEDMEPEDILRCLVLVWKCQDILAICQEEALNAETCVGP